MQRAYSFKALLILGVIVLAALLVAASADRALAATASDTAEVGISIGILEVLISHGDINFGTATGTGYTSVQSGDATVKRNTNWKVTIQADSAAWTGSNGGRADKPCSHLEYNRSWSPGWIQLSTSPTELASGTPGEYTGTMSYRVLIVWADTPGDYQIDVTSTLTGN